MFAEALRKEEHSAYRGRLHTLLGIPEDATELQIHDLIVAGFSTALLVELCEQGDVPARVRDWIIPLRKLKARLGKDERLTVEESDRSFRAMHIIALAQVVFGEREKARRWLNKPKDRFAGQDPLAMLTTTPGVYAVEEMLLQVAEGFTF